MGDFDEHEGHDPRLEEEVLAKKTKKEQPKDDKPSPASSSSKQTSDK